MPNLNFIIDTAFNSQCPVLKAGLQKFHPKPKESSPLVVSSTCGTLQIRLGYACITHLSVAESKVVDSHVLNNRLHKAVTCGLKVWV